MVKLLANENFPKKSTEFLRKKGYDIISIGEDFPGITDSAVLALADHQERVILTFDRDYGELIFKHKYRLKYGIIYLRLEKFKPDDPGILIDRVLSQRDIELDFKLTVVDENGIRQRKY
ncbi:MAG TPA: DUF5615 family PIN-like protein [Saprospiraceae bacterium]|nr:DUF5615 family PIN-like protein [Saprospiraceae bacterium]